MTNREVEERLNAIGERFQAQAKMFRRAVARGALGHVTAVAALLDASGRVAIVGIDDLPHRIEILRHECVRHGSVGFMFLYDGYLTHIDRTAPCPTCRGVGCETCRFTGGIVTGKDEAINTVIRTKWGYTRWVAYPYRVTGTDVQELPVAPMDDGVGLDGYDAVWSPVPTH